VDVTRPYAKGLEARGIPHLLVGSKSFHHREEVETLHAALAAVEWPDDELSVFATLRGSLFAVEDAVLLRFRHDHGKLHPFHPLPDDLTEDFRPVAEGLALLGSLHRQRNRRPVADTVNLLLEAARAHAGFALRPAGHQVLANVHRVADLARNFEMCGGLSFRGFVDELAAQAEKAEAAEAPVLEEGAEGVRLMTVHAAKGLEFPVVVLADMTARLRAPRPDRHVDGARNLCASRLLNCLPRELLDRIPIEESRDEAEGVRVAYVAATRARDLLVVPAVGDAMREGWVSPLNKAIYPAADQWRISNPAVGCPRFGDVTVLERPEDYAADEEASVRPGQHTPQAGEHTVVWWDPRTLRLDVDWNFGLRLDEILQEGPRSAESMSRYDAWKTARGAALANGQRPRYEIVVASEAAVLPLDYTCEVEVASLPKLPGRPAGPRFGALTHAVLAHAGLNAGMDEVSRLARSHGRLLGCPVDEIEAAGQAAFAALGHSLIRRALSAQRVHREYPVMLKLTESQVLEGVIDVAFLEDGAWTILDFKTDAELPGRIERYKAQLTWYAMALSRITGQPARGVLVGV
jgi:ATP-dependent exoDNAse (exonuclease V) beta subunit